ncbi:MAG: hypothetical protein AAF945_09160 [Actinomycetota bacterium]
MLVAILWLGAVGALIASLGCAGTRLERLPGDQGHCASSTGDALLIAAVVACCTALVATVAVIVRAARAAGPLEAVGAPSVSSDVASGRSTLGE